MSTPDLIETAINRQHHRRSFDCGEPALNQFLAASARQAHERETAKTFIVSPRAEPALVMGFYSLTVGQLAFDETPEVIRRGLARHPVPMFRLVRLAVDREFQHQGIGSKLLLAAGRRCLSVTAEVGGVALLIDAKNQGVADWYARFGAIPSPESPLTLALSLRIIEAALREAALPETRTSTT